MIKLTLTPLEAAMIWNLVDGQSDAGACEGGNTPSETKALHSLSDKLSSHIGKFRDALRVFRDESR